MNPVRRGCLPARAPTGGIWDFGSLLILVAFAALVFLLTVIIPTSICYHPRFREPHDESFSGVGIWDGGDGPTMGGHYNMTKMMTTRAMTRRDIKTAGMLMPRDWATNDESSRIWITNESNESLTHSLTHSTESFVAFFLSSSVISPPWLLLFGNAYASMLETPSINNIFFVVFMRAGCGFLISLHLSLLLGSYLRANF